LEDSEQPIEMKGAAEFGHGAHVKRKTPHFLRTSARRKGNSQQAGGTKRAKGTSGWLGKRQAAERPGTRDKQPCEGRGRGGSPRRACESAALHATRTRKRVARQPEREVPLVCHNTAWKKKHFHQQPHSAERCRPMGRANVQQRRNKQFNHGAHILVTRAPLRISVAGHTDFTGAANGEARVHLYVVTAKRSLSAARANAHVTRISTTQAYG
jgi:hypothetical protein